MKCPIDQSDLLMTERQGVEIDYCPKCRGVWLDRGELDKLIDRSDRYDARYDRDDGRKIFAPAASSAATAAIRNTRAARNMADRHNVRRRQTSPESSVI
jgi:Zn-finger nucleic acid-binding protein